MKKTLLLLLTLMCSVMTWANEGDIAYEFKIARNSGNSAYASTYDVTIGNYQWNVPGNHYANGELRLGGKNFSNTDRVITGKSAFTDPIKKVTINHGACSSDKLTVNSITLVVASDANFENVIDNITLTGANGNAIILKSTETTSVDFTPTTLATWPKGAYYKILFNMTCTDTSSNRNVTITSIQFTEGPGGVVVPKYSISKNATTNGSIAVKIGGAEVTEAAENATVSLQATPDDGYRFVSWSVTGATPANVNANPTTFTMGTSAVTVGASFELIPSHNIIISSVSNGSVKATIEGTDVTSALEGEVVSISAIADDGYKFDSWSITGATIANNAPSTTTFTMGASDVNISANFVVTNDIEFSLNNAGFGTSYTGSVAKATIEAAGGSVSQTKSDVTVEYALGTGSNFYISDAQARMYNGNTLTVTAPSGSNISRIAFVRPTKDAGTWPTDKITTDPKGYNKENLEWTGSANSVKFSFSDTHRLAGLIVNLEPTSTDITISSAGYTTYYNSVNAYTMPADCEGYVFTVADGFELAYEANEVVPAGEPLVIHTTVPGTKKTLVFTTSTEGTYKSGDMNDLDGTDEETPLTPDNDAYFYALSKGKEGSEYEGKVGFFWLADNGAAFTNGAHKAYLKLAKNKSSKAAFTFDDETTGINNVKAEAATSVTYNLAGQRVNASVKGIVIMNGKKFINK